MSETTGSSSRVDLRHLRERTQTIGEVSVTLDKTMRTQCTNLHKRIVETLQRLELSLEFMSLEKLIEVVAEFTTALNVVEEDFRHWAKYNRAMTLFKANDMCRSIEHHASRFVTVLALMNEANAMEDYKPDPNPDSLYHQGTREVLEKGLRYVEKLQKALNAAPLLEPGVNIFDNPVDPGVQIMKLRLSPDFEIIPPTEMDAEIERSLHDRDPMYWSEGCSIYKMVWAKRCYVAAKTCTRNPLGLVEENSIPNGNARHYLLSNPGADRVQLIHDVSLGLQYLHDIGVVHRNLTASNVLVNLDGTALISGFSGSKILGPNNERSVYCNISHQKRRWTPPEGEAYWGKEADIWSWSMTAIEILSGDIPFKNIKDLYIETAATIWFEGVRPSPEDYLPRQIATPELWGLLNKCWKYKPEERIKIDEVVADLEAERRRNGWDPTSAPTSGRRRDWERPTSF
ncbi:hypothetical protein FRC01_004684 [Tulasnella sp. 417]|nr:hypothetical protein FRC01_004684 [Tulasnella sp. 417]